MHYKIEDSDLIKDSSLFFTIKIPRWVSCIYYSLSKSLVTDIGRRFADILAKGSHVYLGATSQKGALVDMEIMHKLDFSSISVIHDDLESTVSVTLPLSSDLYDALKAKQAGSFVNVSLNFVTLPILGNLSFSTDASGVTSEPISNLSAERDFGYMVTDSYATNIDSKVAGFVPYSGYNAADYNAFSSLLIRSYARTLLNTQTVDLVDDYNSSPYYDSIVHPNGLKISSLPLRAYEFIYNAFYRDSRNNPFMIDRVPEYNKYLKSDDGGVETNEISFYRRNWESDHLTTACTTPQLGDAPLVGITASGVASFTDVDGVTHEVQLITSPDDGDTITSWKTSDVPNSVQRTLVNLATSGVSISDFRNVNALQRWLELNLRAGIRYKDVIKERWGMNTRFDDALLPEFLGGFSTSIDVNMISNTNGDGQAALGDYAGQGSCFGKLNHNISCVCDEPGFYIVTGKQIGRAHV